MMKVKKAISLSVQLYNLLRFEECCLPGLYFMQANKNLPSFQNLPPPLPPSAGWNISLFFQVASKQQVTQTTWRRILGNSNMYSHSTDSLSPNFLGFMSTAISLSKSLLLLLHHKKAGCGGNATGNIYKFQLTAINTVSALVVGFLQIQRH